MPAGPCIPPAYFFACRPCPVSKDSPQKLCALRPPQARSGGSPPLPALPLGALPRGGTVGPAQEHRSAWGPGPILVLCGCRAPRKSVFPSLFWTVLGETMGGTGVSLYSASCEWLLF